MRLIPWLSIDASRHALEQGQVIAYPTEAVYGIGGLCQPKVIEMVCRLKSRPVGQGLIIVSHRSAHLQPWVDVDLSQYTLISPDAHPTTWVMPASDEAPSALLGPEKTLAIRLSDHPTICALCDAVDAPIISTSANRRGEVAARSAGAVIEALGDEIAGVTVGMLGGVDTPSHLRTWQGQRLR